MNQLSPNKIVSKMECPIETYWISIDTNVCIKSIIPLSTLNLYRMLYGLDKKKVYLCG